MALKAVITSSKEMGGISKTGNESPLLNLVKRLSYIIREKQDNYQPGHLSAEWTKKVLVMPLLESLGWDKGTDIIHELRPGNKGGLDMTLNCQTPVGIEVRPLHELPPGDTGALQINEAFRECKSKKVPYLIWTNGETWLFFSLALADAAFYQISLSRIEDDNSLLKKLQIIKKDAFMSNPDRFNRAITRNTALKALSDAWTTALRDHPKELLQLFRKGLKGVEMKDEVILKFLKTIKPGGPLTQARLPRQSGQEELLHKKGSSISFKADGLMSHGRSSAPHKSDDLIYRARSANYAPKSKNWDRLIDSYESPYRLARWFFRTSYYRKLGEYLISENYRPWSKDSTWRHLGLMSGKNEEKKVRHAVMLFQEWGFIKETEAEKYCRVEGCSPILKQLLEKTTPH